MSLSIGSILGDPQASSTAMGKAVQAILGWTAEMRINSAIDQMPEINVVFQIPGKIFQPEFEGIRTGRYSSREKIFMIQVAVPQDQIASNDPGKFVIESLRIAVRMAKPRFDKHALPFSVESHLAFISLLESRWNDLRDDSGMNVPKC